MRLPLDTGPSCMHPLALLCLCLHQSHASRSPCAAGYSLYGYTGGSDPLRQGPRCTSLNLHTKVYSRSDHTMSFTAQEDEGREEPRLAMPWNSRHCQATAYDDTNLLGHWILSNLYRLRPGPHYCSHLSPDSSLWPPKGASCLELDCLLPG